MTAAPDHVPADPQEWNRRLKEEDEARRAAHLEVIKGGITPRHGPRCPRSLSADQIPRPDGESGRSATSGPCSVSIVAWRSRRSRRGTHSPAEHDC